MSALERVARYLVVKQLADLGYVVDFIYAYFSGGSLGDAQRFGLSKTCARGYVQRIIEYCNGSFFRARAIVRHVYRFVKQLEPVILRIDGVARCTICGAELVPHHHVLQEHVARRHPDRVDDAVEKVIDAVVRSVKRVSNA